MPRLATVLLVLALAGCGEEPRPAPPRPADAPPDVAAATPAVGRACARIDDLRVAVRCPRVLPRGRFELPRSYGVAPCSYLLNLEPRGGALREAPLFHVLFGGRCGRWSLVVRGGRWPAAAPPADARRRGLDLRLGAGLRVVRRTPSLLVLANPPYPEGGIHGGHLTVVWNAGGDGYAVSAHVRADVPSSVAVRTLVAVARSMRLGAG